MADPCLRCRHYSPAEGQRHIEVGECCIEHVQSIAATMEDLDERCLNTEICVLHMVNYFQGYAQQAKSEQIWQN